MVISPRRFAAIVALETVGVAVTLLHLIWRPRMSRKAFAKNISLLIEAHGWSPLRAALELGVSPSMITKYTHGQSFPTVEKLMEIADKLDVSTDVLLGRAPLRLVPAPPTGHKNGGLAPNHR